MMIGCLRFGTADTPCNYVRYASNETENDKLIIKHLHFELVHALLLIMSYLLMRYERMRYAFDAY